DILADSSITFSNFEGQVVLLDFFATWCDPCKTAMVELAELRHSYSAQQLVMISIGTDPAYDSEASLEAFAVTYNMNWKIVIDTIGLSDYYQITNIPTIYIFDKNLNVAYRNVGVVGSTLLEGVIDPLLGDSSSQPTTTRSSGNSADGFWVNNWYWVVILIIFTIIGISIFIQRRIVLMNNKKIREKELAEKKRKAKIRKLRR
ncbi:MAG: TlpA family protein disulfide reductase, partial [Candidatus Heimdallarchaeota archaeon]|nr:TlpA family protein disulfide reductase [Candidatus Heimdallarchaeota archaeon]